MLILLSLTVVTLVAILAFPDTGSGRWLTRWLVVEPARALNRISTGKLTFYALLTALGAVIVLLFEIEGLRLFGFMLPETLVWFAMFDVGVFIDAVLIGSAIVASNGLRVLKARVAAVVRQTRVVTARRMARSRQTRRSPTRPGRKEPSADGDGQRWVDRRVFQFPYRAHSIA